MLFIFPVKVREIQTNALHPKKILFFCPLNQRFPLEVEQRGGFNNRLLFKNKELLFSLLFCENFCGGQGCDGGAQSADRGILPSPPPSTKENPVNRAKFFSKLTLSYQRQIRTNKLTKSPCVFRYFINSCCLWSTNSHYFLGDTDRTTSHSNPQRIYSCIDQIFGLSSSYN